MDQPIETREENGYTVKLYFDDYPDHFRDCIGRYSDCWEKGAFDRAWVEYSDGQWGYPRSRECRYFIPAVTPKEANENAAWHYAHGDSKHQAWLKGQKTRHWQYERARDYESGGWCFVGVVVELPSESCKCCRQAVEFSRSLWGIESDSEDYIDNHVIPELLAEVKAERFKWRQKHGRMRGLHRGHKKAA